MNELSAPMDSAHPLHLVIIGWNRPHSLARLVASIRDADYGRNTRVPVTIAFALDHAENATVDGEMDAVVDALARVWPHGEVRVRRRRTRAGLRDNVLGAWRPASDTAAPAVFLEDDIELSPLWWHWVQACLRRYASPPRTGLLGISLYTPDDMNEQFTNGPYRDASGKSLMPCDWQAQHARARRVGVGRRLWPAVLVGRALLCGGLAALPAARGDASHHRRPPIAAGAVPVVGASAACTVGASHTVMDSRRST